MSMSFYNVILQEDDTLWRNKTEEKQSSVTIIISVDRKGTVFPVKNKYMKKENFKKDLVNWTEANHKLTWSLSVLFEAITGLKAIQLKEFQNVFNIVESVQSAMILLQCLLQGW